MRQMISGFNIVDDGVRRSSPSRRLVLTGSVWMTSRAVSEALYLRNPDDNGVELYWDRKETDWPRTLDGQLNMGTKSLDLDDLLRER